jgi:hypothetical protein
MDAYELASRELASDARYVDSFQAERYVTTEVVRAYANDEQYLLSEAVSALSESEQDAIFEALDDHAELGRLMANAINRYVSDCLAQAAEELVDSGYQGECDFEDREAAQAGQWS